jgi:hypothetical protein
MPMECVRSEPTEKGGNAAHVSSHAASADLNKGLYAVSLPHVMSRVHGVEFIVYIVVDQMTAAVASALDSSRLFSCRAF